MLQLCGLLSAADCAQTLAQLAPLYAQAQAEACAGGGSNERYSVQSSSLRLGRLPGFDLTGWVRGLWRGRLPGAVERAVGAGPLLNLDQCWLRRQFPPGAAPAGHAPHGWHQDGALHADFSATPLPAPLRMLTVWIALVACGEESPSLQWADDALTMLLSPAELARAGDGRRLRHATLRAGDALLFDGGLLHRTHLTPTMTAARSSLELRFFAGPPAQPALRGERLLALG